MDLFANMGAVAVVSLLGAISPGPDFFIVLKNSLVYSRRSGIFTALGVVTALLVHLSYTLVGLAIVIEENPFVYSMIKSVGAAYLVYIGLRGVVGVFKNRAQTLNEYGKAVEALPAKAAFMQGLLTNLLNPKCALFFISLFSQFITPSTPGLVKIAYGAINWSLSLGWFVFLSVLVTNNAFHSRMSGFRSAIDGVMGCVLVLLGLKILFV